MNSKFSCQVNSWEKISEGKKGGKQFGPRFLFKWSLVSLFVDFFHLVQYF